MIARDVRTRSGITLVEILIAILIMGVGLISLATLFPLGLLRLREATRNSRGGLTYETAADDMDTRALFYKPSFTQTWYWTPGPANSKVPRDPFVQDAFFDGTIGDGTAANGVIASGTSQVIGATSFVNNNVGLYSGLPFCYDPLWRSITGVLPRTSVSDPTLSAKVTYGTPYMADEARFGAGLFGSSLANPYVRNDPGDSNLPSAHGLQRLTNFVPWTSVNLTTQYPFTCLNLNLNPANQPNDVSGVIFASNDDIVFNAFNPNGGTPNPSNPNGGSPSSLIPDMSVVVGTIPQPQSDYRFTWFVTGRQTDAGGNGSQFTGEIVVCDGRPFGWDPIPGQSINAPAGETVVEAIFGYGSNISNLVNGYGFATGADRTVLLRWPVTLADPQIRAGGWICDVTYERFVPRFKSRSSAGLTAFAHCYWYQIGKRTDPQVDTLDPNSTVAYRSTVLTLTSPVRAKTLLNQSSKLPYHVNVALVMPSVINVYPRDFEVHPIPVP